MIKLPGKKSVYETDIMQVFEKEIKKAEQTLQKVDEIYRKDLRRLDKLSDKIAQIGGSWSFILLFFVILFSWMGINTFMLVQKSFDPYPFILLNLVLSCLAAIQAPIILMSQNRAAKRDQARAELDLEKDLRDLKIDQQSHKILLAMQKDMVKIKQKLKVK
ncbi:MAG: hypothetical protein QT02_C0002G0015 [archaeon GW2011_AR9]|nr:MAG: hypothetical protein QT02_C0002G0015 [archaeon GW2011_AR9]